MEDLKHALSNPSGFQWDKGEFGTKYSSSSREAMVPLTLYKKFLTKYDRRSIEVYLVS